MIGRAMVGRGIEPGQRVWLEERPLLDGSIEGYFVPIHANSFNTAPIDPVLVFWADPLQQTLTSTLWTFNPGRAANTGRGYEGSELPA